LQRGGGNSSSKGERLGAKRFGPFARSTPQREGSTSSAQAGAGKSKELSTPTDIKNTPVDVETPAGKVTTVSSEADMASSSGTA
jgi:hypothetical protein